MFAAGNRRAPRRLPEVSVADGVVEGRHGLIPIRVYGPALDATTDNGTKPALIWVHGGGFAWGSLDGAEADGPARVVAATGRTVVTVDYTLVPRRRRTPESFPLRRPRWPVPVDDLSDAMTWVASRCPQGRFMLGGASAGACLSAAATLRAVHSGDPVPERLLLVYGLFHRELPPLPDSVASRLRGPNRFAAFTPASVAAMMRNYAGSERALRDPHAIPGGGDLAGMPPCVLVDADRDSLRAFHEEMRFVLAGLR